MQFRHMVDVSDLGEGGSTGEGVARGGAEPPRGGCGGGIPPARLGGMVSVVSSPIGV